MQFITARHSNPVSSSTLTLPQRFRVRCRCGRRLAVHGAMSDRPSVCSRTPVPTGDAVAADDDVPALLPCTRARTHGASSDSGQSRKGEGAHGHAAEAPPSAMRRAVRAGSGRGTQPSARTNRGAISVPARVPFDLVGRPAPGVAQGQGAIHPAAPRRWEQGATPFTEEDLERGARARAGPTRSSPAAVPLAKQASCAVSCVVPHGCGGRACRVHCEPAAAWGVREPRGAQGSTRSINNMSAVPAPRLARNAVREATQHLLASVTSPARECHQPASRCANAGLESIAEVPGDDRNGHEPGPAMIPPAAPARAKPWPWGHPCACACAPADEPRGACTS